MGFLATRDTDLEGNARLRLLGPLFERQEAVDRKSFVAVRPFYSSIDEPARERSLSEFLWPLGMIKKDRRETSWRFLTFFGHDWDNSEPYSRYHIRALPLLFAGRDKNQEKYFAVFPLGGKINEFLGRDRIIFALFPLYAFSSVNDVKTQDVLWPLISWTTRLRSGSYGGQEGEEVSRFRIFPFYGKSVKSGQWAKKFVLWPVWTSARYDLPDSSGSGFVLFPLFGRVNMKNQQTWMFLPPLFRWSRSAKLRELNCPWPLVQYSSGEIDKFYVWPLWGKKSVNEVRTSFLLWPIVSWQEIGRGDYEVNRFTVLPLVFYESQIQRSEVRGQTSDVRGEGSGVGGESSNVQRPTSNVEVMQKPDVVGRYFKLWPVGSYRREGDAARVGLLDLWPARRASSIEKNMAPFWTLYSHVRVGKAREDELLWGFFRYRRDGQGERSVSLFPVFSTRRSSAEEGSCEWSFLLGLAGYKREGLRKTFRLLYFGSWSTGNH